MPSKKILFDLKGVNFLSVISGFCIRSEDEAPMTKEQKEFVRKQYKEAKITDQNVIICAELMMGESPKGATIAHTDIIKTYEKWREGMRQTSIRRIEEAEEEVVKAKRMLKATIGRGDPRGKGKLLLGKKKGTK